MPYDLLVEAKGEAALPWDIQKYVGRLMRAVEDAWDGAREHMGDSEARYRTRIANVAKERNPPPVLHPGQLVTLRRQFNRVGDVKAVGRARCVSLGS